MPPTPTHTSRAGLPVGRHVIKAPRSEDFIKDLQASSELLNQLGEKLTQAIRKISQDKEST